MKHRKKYKRSYRKKIPRSHPRFQMEGKEIGNIKVISYSHSKDRRSHWNCLCFCGKETIISRKKMFEKTSISLSCGCVTRRSTGTYTERTYEEKKTHKINCLINLSHPEGNCRIWDGYYKEETPRASFLDKAMSVRKLMWILHNGDVPERSCVTNICMNKKCIELKHLYLIPKGGVRGRRVKYKIN